MIGRYVSQRSQCGFVSSCSAAADSVPRVDPAFERLLTARFGPLNGLRLVLTVITDFREIFIGTERQNQAERLALFLSQSRSAPPPPTYPGPTHAPARLWLNVLIPRAPPPPATGPLGQNGVNVELVCARIDLSFC